MANHQEKSNYTYGALIKDFWLLLNGSRLKFLFFTVILAISASIPFLITYYLGRIVDFFTVYQKGDSLNFFYMAVIIIGIAGSLQVWSRFLCKWNILQIGTEVRMRIRVLAMTKLADLELKWHEKQGTGSKIQRITGGSESIYKLFGFYLDALIPTITGILGSLILIGSFNIKYILFSVTFAGIYLYGEYKLNASLAFWQTKLNLGKEKVAGKIHEAASNMLTVKTLGLQANMKESIQEHEEEYKKIWEKARKAKQDKVVMQKVFTALLYAVFVFILGIDAMNGKISVGVIFILAGYFGRLKGSLEEVTNRLNEIVELKAGAERITSLLDKKTIEKESHHFKNIPTNWKKITFKNVGFKYKDKWVLRNFNLEIKKGEKIGVVGASGEGKSTILKLLLGLYEPQEGTIMIDNLPIDKAKNSSLTNTITAVLQDSEMFNMPLKENVSITGTEFNEILFNTAIRTAEVTDIIKKLPKGVDTMIGEKGYKVSGGERQRIGIARAVYKNSDVMILDEATSHLDSKTEEKIQRNMKQFLEDKTVIIIAHRLSTLRDVDSIIVIEKGKIAEQGSFEKLVNRKGKFFELWKQQRSTH